MELMYERYGNFENAMKIFYEQIYNGKNIQSILTEFDLNIDTLILGLHKYGQEENYIHAVIDYYQQFHIPTNKVLVISDTHIGRKNETFERMILAYGHAIKNNINYIIHVGDLIEGLSDPSSFPLSKNEQIEKVRSIYSDIPNNIITYYIYGNHDYNLLHFNSTDIKEFLTDLKNLKYIGTRYSFINLIDNDLIKLFHEIPILEKEPEPPIKTNLILQGHSHVYSIRGDNTLILPALHTSYNRTGFIELETTGNEYITRYHPITPGGILEKPVEQVFKKQLIKN